VLDYSCKLLGGVGKDKRKVVGNLVLLDIMKCGGNEVVHGPSCIEYLYSLLSSFSALFHLPSLPSLILFLPYILTHSYRMPFLPSLPDPKLLNTPSLSPPDYLTHKFPSNPNQIESTNPHDQMNPYQLIALKARQATKEREAKRKARLLERSSQSSGSGSSGMMSSGESSLGDGSFPRERSEWGRVQPNPTAVPPSLPSPTSSSIESSESQTNRDPRDDRSIPNLITTTHTTPLTQASFEQDSQIPNGPVPPSIPNGINEISHDTTMEEEDDDADLRRLMNQAQAMLNISGNPSSSESKSPDNSNGTRVLEVETELNKGKVVGISVLPDLNDERR
jgi:hypothetical protein